ncbi:hypothetical protein TUZN_0275 [Thermoproteus uzoniensis 768-20]|uniref:Transcriptional regulator n=1 Tax=Thermoproteus uzoniensis (strain 768-20) TaxID=999630 RepID=F2L2A8_THEU7|nr:hypothetical protein [Thermoproteus uzoniensis]AEA11773.1 hypothetical protein TUZN_0275 [Thermoproteus uzoniensis 768-20]
MSALLERLNVKLDEKELRILLGIITSEPTTAYKVAVDNRMHFSYVYKKLESFEREELVAYFCEPGNGRKLYYVLPKGILALMAYEALSPRMAADKLRDRWNLKDFSDEEVLELADIFLKNYRPGTPVNDAVMSAYVLYTRYLAGELNARNRAVLNKFFRRAFEALIGLIGEECLQKCGQDIAARDYI